ncbi:MAG: N-acetylmuramoyl-L-alanine amidase [Clostridiales bacterium]|nr:N-acetylmuramoyl-L-alanine amidase [Clostridiales bacterium]
MFILLKKRNILIGCLVVALTVALCLAVTVTATSAYSVPKTGKTVVIDAGHGGADGGVVGVTTSVKESDVNLAVARQLKHFLKTKGYDVIMTRSTTDGLYGMTTKNKKLKDMQERKKIIENANADLVVSVHCNSYPRHDQTGAQVFYAPGSDEGKRMAESMQSILGATLQSTRKAMQGDYYILQCSPVPSLLVECGFLTTPSEEKLLVSSSYQEKVAYAIFTGIHTILGGESA